MAISYDDWKKQYEGLTTEQQKSYANMVKGNATATEYANRYIQEKQNAGTFGNQTATSYTNANQSTNTSSSNNYSSNSNNQNGSTYDYSSNNTGSNNNNNTWTTNTNNTGNTNNTTSSGSPLSDWKNGNGWTYWKFTFDADEYLDTNKFWKSNWEITVKEWTAAQTGRPDYEIETKERLTEMVNNLNTYWDSNPEFFNDRETFNRVFEYNTRQSQAQRDLLDSYWKKAQDYKKASSYNNSASFTSDLDSWNVSESEFEALKKYNQDVYIQWQKEMQDKLNAAIANLANPFSIDDMTTALNKIVEKFNLQAWDPYDIIWWWENMMQRTWAWDSMNEAKKHFTAADNAIAQIKRIQSNYSSSTWGNQSDTLVAARLQKALLPYETLLSNELSAWQHWQSLYNTQLGTANNYANTIQMQAKEDERIFQQKLAWLWFAIKAYTTRTPEQTAQLQLQVSQISQDMALLNQSKQNDLALYNMAATTRLQNQLNYEMQDLTVTDPKQLRANLSNVLDQWYEQYWDIIQRPKSQVIEDVIAYAKANNMSVWEALRKNFIEPLMSKQEYKNSIRDKYWMNTTNEYIKIWDSWAILSKNPDGSFSVSYLWWWTWVGWVWGTVWNDWVYKFSDAEVRDIWWDGKYTDTIWNDINSIWHILQSNDWLRVWTYTSKNWYTYNVYPDRETWIQATVNLLKKWYYWKTLADAAQKWIWQWKDISNAKSVIQQFWLSLDAKLDDSNVRKFIEAMWTWEWTLKWQSLDEWAKWGKDLSWYATVAETKWVTSDPYAWVSWYTNNWTEINSGWWITSLESTYAQDKWRSDWDRDAVLNWYWITIKDFNEQRKKYAEHMMATELQSTLQDSLDRINALIEWEDKENSWIWDYHQWWLDRMSVDTEGGKSWVDNLINPLWTYTDATKWKALFDYLKNNETLNKFLNLKQNWATFWAMQQAEWDMIASSVSELKWEQPKEVFQDNLKKVKERLENQMMELDPTYTADWWIPKDYLEKHWIKFEYQPWPWSVNIDLTWMIDYVAW